MMIIGRCSMSQISLALVRAVLSVSAVLLCCWAYSDPGHTEPAVTVAGTLTCTVGDVPNAPSVAVDLSCNFKSQAGTNSDYVGSGSTRAGVIPPAKFVFVWTVVAVASDKAPVLDGQFTMESGRQGPAVLVGGENASLRLEPVTGKEQIAGPAEITTLTLRLAQTKT